MKVLNIAIVLFISCNIGFTPITYCSEDFHLLKLPQITLKSVFESLKYNLELVSQPLPDYYPRFMNLTNDPDLKKIIDEVDRILVKLGEPESKGTTEGPKTTLSTTTTSKQTTTGPTSTTKQTTESQVLLASLGPKRDMPGFVEFRDMLNSRGLQPRTQTRTNAPNSTIVKYNTAEEYYLDIPKGVSEYYGDLRNDYVHLCGGSDKMTTHFDVQRNIMYILCAGGNAYKAIRLKPIRPSQASASPMGRELTRPDDSTFNVYKYLTLDSFYADLPSTAAVYTGTVKDSNAHLCGTSGVEIFYTDRLTFSYFILCKDSTAYRLDPKNASYQPRSTISSTAVPAYPPNRFSITELGSIESMYDSLGDSIPVPDIPQELAATCGPSGVKDTFSNQVRTLYYYSCNNGKSYYAASSYISSPRSGRKKRSLAIPNRPFDSTTEAKKRFNITISALEDVSCGLKSYNINCKLSKGTIQMLEKCNITTNTKFEELSELTDNCRAILVIASLSIVNKGHIQPTVNHFFDNEPQKKNLTISSILNPLPPNGRTIEQLTLNCNGDQSVNIKTQTCYTVLKGDINSIYKTKTAIKFDEYSSAHIISTQDHFSHCEMPQHPFKDVMLLPSLTGHYDTVGYSIGKFGDIGFRQDDCSLLVCNVCIKEVPYVFGGTCRFKSKITQSGHTVQLCNTELKQIAYSVRLLHTLPRITNDYDFQSRFLIMNLYNYIHYKIVGSNPHLIDDGNFDNVIKGSIQPSTCTEVVVAPLTTSWLYYYIKCGQEISHHNEYIDQNYKCDIYYGSWTLGTVLKWVCKHWYTIRIFLILIVVFLFTFICNILGLLRYITIILCMVLSPISYLIYKIWPSAARCSRCWLPWSPWHCCPDVCLCGEKFTTDHRYDCVIYGHDEQILHDAENHPKIGEPKYIDYIKSLAKDLKSVGPTQSEVPSRKYTIMETIKKPSKDAYKYWRFHAFSSCRNPFTIGTVRLAYILIVYIVLCLCIPTSIAECIQCTQNCHWNGASYTRECTGAMTTCLCTLGLACEDNKTVIYSSSNTGLESEREDLYNVNGCMEMIHVPNDTFIDMIIATLLMNNDCLKSSITDSKELKDFASSVATGLPRHYQLYVLNNKLTNCKTAKRDLESFSGVRIRRSQLRSSPILNSDGIDMSAELKVTGLGINSNARIPIKGHQKVDITKEIKDHLKPIQQVVKERADEEVMRQRGELIHEFQYLINLIKFNGSIFGRDYSISYPSPPSFVQHVYTSKAEGKHTILDMSMAATAGTSVAFRPVHNGKEVPVTLILSVPEVAGVYDLLYSYTTCNTRTVDVIRHDKCIGQCSECFNLLFEDIKAANVEHMWSGNGQYEKISFESPNTWGCEGEGCWTINTGCLCAVCKNIPDISDCYDIYKLQYKQSKALLCLAVNEEHQCEQMSLGQVASRSGKLQFYLDGSDEWASAVKTEAVAIHRRTGGIRMGQIAALGESTGDFGHPQYNYNLSTILYKEGDVDSHYLCKSGEDQEVIVNSCFKDTWPMHETLQDAPAFFRDTKNKILYHVGSTIGSFRVVLEVPVDQLVFKTEKLKVTIPKAVCHGCSNCIAGSLCTVRIESTHTGLVYVYVEGGIIRVSTLNILKGVNDYNITVDFDKNTPKPFIIIKDSDGNQIIRKSMSTSLRDGNEPRTTQRNTTMQQVNVISQNSNTYNSFLDKIKKYNPITLLSGLFSSSWMHWILYIALFILLVCLLIFLILKLASWVYKRSLNKLTIGKQE